MTDDGDDRMPSYYGIEMKIRLSGVDARLARQRLGRELVAMADMNLGPPNADAYEAMFRNQLDQAREDLLAMWKRMEREQSGEE